MAAPSCGRVFSTRLASSNKSSLHESEVSQNPNWLFGEAQYQPPHPVGARYGHRRSWHGARAQNCRERRPLAGTRGARAHALESAPSKSNASTNSADHYQPDANFYVLGEVYSPELSGSGPGGDGVQQLLQMERSLQYLCAKERKAVLDCIAGAMFIGPMFEKRARANMARELLAHPARFPCLTALQGASRLLALCIPFFLDAAVAALRVGVHHQGMELTDLARRLTALEALITGNPPALEVVGAAMVHAAGTLAPDAGAGRAEEPGSGVRAQAPPCAGAGEGVGAGDATATRRPAGGAESDEVNSGWLIRLRRFVAYALENWTLY